MSEQATSDLSVEGKLESPFTTANSHPNPFERDKGEVGEHRVVKGGPEWWRRTFSYMTGLGKVNSEEERLRYERDREIKREQDQCRKCEKWRDYNLKHSPIIRFLYKNINSLATPNYELLPAQHIRCLPCAREQSGGFSPYYGILLCQNKLLSRSHTEDTLAHEMMHTYDHLRFNIDWMDLRHHACSEIRASSLSGECRWTREGPFGRGVWNFTRQHQECVRRRATLSVRGHPKCQSDVQAAKVVNSVWDSCFNDTRPFDEIYR